MPAAKSIKDLFNSIVDGKFTKDGSKLITKHDFDLNKSDANLISLVGSPEATLEGFNCSYSRNLKSLIGGPKKVGGNFECRDTGITSLKNAPLEVNGDFECSDNRGITSLKGAPAEIGGSFYCSNTGITSLIGSPKKVGRNFSCYGTGITSLVGAPKEVGGYFHCTSTQLTSLEAINFYVHEINGSAIFLRCGIVSNILGLLKIKGLEEVEFDNKKLEAIMNKYLPLGNISECMDELLDNDFKEYAKW